MKILAKKMQHKENEVEPGNGTDVLKWKGLCHTAAHGIILRGYLKTEKDRNELHLFNKSSEGMTCAVVSLHLQSLGCLIDFVFESRKIW